MIIIKENESSEIWGNLSFFKFFSWKKTFLKFWIVGFLQNVLNFGFSFTKTSHHISYAPVFIHWNLYSYVMCTCFHSQEPLFITHVTYFIHWNLYSYLMCTCFHSLEPLFITHVTYCIHWNLYSYLMCTCFHSMENLFISHMHLSLFTKNSIHISCAPVFIYWNLYS